MYSADDTLGLNTMQTLEGLIKILRREKDTERNTVAIGQVIL